MPCSKKSARVCTPLKTIKGLFGVLAVCALAGCATQPVGVDLPPMSDWEMRQSVLAERDHWEFRGRVGIKTDDDGFNAGFRWEQQRSSFQASLRGPLGIGTVLIDGRDQSVQLTDNDGVTTLLQDAEAELYARYGWTIPLRSLRYWALGIPDPAQHADIEFDQSGRATLIEQSGWSVELERYRPAAGAEMPHRLTATHPTTRVRVVVDDWTFY